MAKRVIQNIVGQTSNYDLAKISLSYTQNMYEETVNATESSTTKILRSISGISENFLKHKYHEIDGEPIVRGLYYTSEVQWSGKEELYIVIGNNLYLYNNKNLFYICSVAPGKNTIHFVETLSNGVFGKYMCFVDGTNCFAINIDEHPTLQGKHVKVIALPQKLNSDKTISPTHIAYLYGYIVVNDAASDYFYTSYQYPFNRLKSDSTSEIDSDIFETTSGEYGVKGHYTMAEWQPDNITALCTNSSRLFVFGKKSYQVFQYTNDVNNPFSSPDTAAKKIGLMTPESVSQLGEYTCWLGSADVGNFGIYLNVNGSIESTRISNYAIEEQLAKSKNIADSTSTMFQERGHIFYLLSVPDLHTTFCYDITEQSWTNRVSYDDANQPQQWRYRTVVADSFGNLITACVDSKSIGQAAHYVYIGNLTADSNLDFPDKPIIRIRRGGIISNNNRRFYIDAISLHLSDGQSKWPELDKANGHIGLSCSVDGATWSDKEIVEIGGQGEYDYDCIWYNFGIGKYFAIEISCSDNMPFAIYNMNIDYSECAW